MNEDITDLIEYIEWKKVSLDLILEFLMKHYKLIETLEVEKIFSEIVTYKLSNLNGSHNGTSNNNSFDVEMVKMLMSSLFSKFYWQKKNIRKFIFIFQFFYFFKKIFLKILKL